MATRQDQQRSKAAGSMKKKGGGPPAQAPEEQMPQEAAPQMPPDAGGGGGAPIIGIVQQGAPGPVALAWPVELTAPQESQPAPNPSAIVGPLAAGLLEPDRALRTRARVLTDESSYNDDMYGGATSVPLTGICLFTNGSTAVVGQAGVSLFATEVRCGDYVILAADFLTTAPLRWGRVAAIIDNTHLTLEAAYAGPGGAAGVSWLARWVSFQDGVSGGEFNGASIEQLSTGIGAAGQSGIFRAVGVPGGKQGLPIDIYWYGSVSARNATQTCEMGLVSPSYAGGPWLASIRWLGTDPDTTIRCRSSGGAGGSDLWDETVVMPGGALAVNYHLYRLRATINRVDFRVDPHLNPTPVASHQGHVPYPYGSYVVVINAYNTGVPVGSVNLLTDEIVIVNDNDVRAEVEQPDASKLNATVALAGILAESKPAPDPSARGEVSSLEVQLEPAMSCTKIVETVKEAPSGVKLEEAVQKHAHGRPKCGGRPCGCG
jgi:hypothetical protein